MNKQTTTHERVDGPTLEPKKEFVPTSTKIDHKGVCKRLLPSSLVTFIVGRFFAYRELGKTHPFFELTLACQLACYATCHTSADQISTDSMDSLSDAGDSADKTSSSASSTDTSPDSPSSNDNSTSGEESSADGDSRPDDSNANTGEEDSNSADSTPNADSSEASDSTPTSNSSSSTEDSDTNSESESETGSDDNVRIDEYEATSTPFYVQASGGDNLSGIAWNPDTNTYFSVVNNVGTIYELQRDLKRSIRKIQFNGPDRDIESIRYLGNHTFAIVSEINAVFILTIDSDDSTAGTKSQTITFAPKPDVANHGAEGIAIDLDFGENGRFWAVQENLPMKIYQFDRPNDHLDHSFLDDLTVVEPFDPAQKFSIQEMSDVTFDPRTGHLLILSHEQSCIIEVDPKQGNTLAKLELPTEINGFPSQWEGIAIGPHYELALVSESSGDSENRAQIYHWTPP